MRQGNVDRIRYNRAVISQRSIIIVTFLGGLVALGLGLGLFLSMQSNVLRISDPPGIKGLLWPQPKLLTPFTLIDQRGSRFDLEKLKGTWSFVFFGYTHCPDICPITLAVFDSVHNELVEHPSSSGDLQFIFVSVDPERDTPEQLGNYVNYFNAAFLGLSGNEQELSGLTRQLGILYLRTEPDDSENYLVDHTAAVFLIDPLGRLVAIFSPPHDAKQMATRFIDIRDFVESQT